MDGKNDARRGSAGLKIVRRKLADGTVREYRYQRAARRARVPDGALRALFNAYTASPEFERLAPASRSLYGLCMTLAERELGWMTKDDLEHARARAEFYALRDAHADRPSFADMIVRVLAIVLAWAYDRGELAANHAAKMRRLIDDQHPRADRIYTEVMEATLLTGLPEDLRSVFVVGLYTGLRRGDLCALSPSSIRAGWLTVVPEKTRRSTGVPVHLPIDELPPLAEIVRTLPTTGPALLLQASGRPWTPYALTYRWSAALEALAISDRHFHDIRGTTATRLVMAGCTEAERGAIMGHAIASGAGAAYTARVRELSINAYRKWTMAIERGPVVVRPTAWKIAGGK